MIPPRKQGNIEPATDDQIEEARRLLGMIENDDHLYRSRRFAPGWWILPGAVIGLALWIAAIWAAWKALEAYL